jgi:hypothetical protein
MADNGYRSEVNRTAWASATVLLLVGAIVSLVRVLELSSHVDHSERHLETLQIVIRRLYAT